MYSGKDVVDAFSHPDVQAALADHRRFSAVNASSLKARGHAGSIRWVANCTGCDPAPHAVTHFLSVLEVVMLNRKLVCE